MSAKGKSERGGEEDAVVVDNEEEKDGAVAVSNDDGTKEEGRERKIKKSLLSAFRRFRKQTRKRRLPAHAPATATHAGKSGCCLCFRPSVPPDSIPQQPTDPNSPEFGYVFLKELIEKNDFYAHECNVHT